MTQITIPKKEIEEFFSEYDIDIDALDTQIEEKVDLYKQKLNQVRKNFYAIDKSLIPCFGKNMYQDRVAKQRKLIQQYCSACNYEFDCAYLAVLNKEDDGVWGGLETKVLKSIVNDLNKEKVYENFSQESEVQIINLIKSKKNESA